METKEVKKEAKIKPKAKAPKNQNAKVVTAIVTHRFFDIDGKKQYEKGDEFKGSIKRVEAINGTMWKGSPLNALKVVVIE